MKVEVVCFGAMRDFLPEGTADNRAEIELAEGSRVADVVDALGAPEHLVYALLVDGEKAGLGHAVDDGAVITLMPPFAGGSRARDGMEPKDTCSPGGSRVA